MANRDVDLDVADSYYVEMIQTAPNGLSRTYCDERCVQTEETPR